MSPSAPSPSAPPPSHTTRQRTARRLRAMGIGGRRLRRGWTHERSMEVLRTMVYVVPLTLLIWVWAQDQQIETRAYQNIPIRIDHVDGQRVVTILRTATGETVNRRGGNVLVTLAFHGPRIGLNAVLRSVGDDQQTALFDVLLRGRTTDQTTVSLRDQLNELGVLQEAGVSVVETTPSELVVRIEERKQVEARLVAGNADTEELAGPVEFDPPAITLSGPAGAIAALEGPDGTVTLPVELPTDLAPGDHERSLRVSVPPGIPEGITPQSMLVTARFTRREAREEPLELPFAVPVLLEMPAALSGRLHAENVDPTVVNGVRVQGASNLIERLRANDAELREQIRAVVRLDGDDDALVNEQITRQATIQLPQGLRLLSNAPQVTFTLRRADSL